MAISDEITRLQTAKSDLKTSINTKLGSATHIANETIDDYAGFVDNISTGVPINNQNKTITSNGTYIADTGYTGIGTATVNITPDTSDATATASDITEGKTAYTADGKVTGTLPDCWNLTKQNSGGIAAYLKAFPFIDTSGYTSFSGMFGGMKCLLEIPQIDTSNVTEFSTAFQNCRSLTAIPQIDTSNGTRFYYAFGGCSSLMTIPLLNFSKATDVRDMFAQIYNITTLGGFQNLGQAYLTTASANYNNYSLSFSQQNSGTITTQSILNVINNLYDIATKGCNTQTLQLGNIYINRLTAEEIAIATNKGWTVS